MTFKNTKKIYEQIKNGNKNNYFQVYTDGGNLFVEEHTDGNSRLILDKQYTNLRYFRGGEIYNWFGQGFKAFEAELNHVMGDL